jgi:hypothetical protein
MSHESMRNNSYGDFMKEYLFRNEAFICIQAITKIEIGDTVYFLSHSLSNNTFILKHRDYKCIILAHLFFKHFRRLNDNEKTILDILE